MEEKIMSNDFMRIANCRGKMSVLNDIKNAYMILSRISVEFNYCVAKSKLIATKEQLWTILIKRDMKLITITDL